MCLSFGIAIEFKKLIKGHRGGGESLSEGRTECRSKWEEQNRKD